MKSVDTTLSNMFMCAMVLFERLALVFFLAALSAQAARAVTVDTLTTNDTTPTITGTLATGETLNSVTVNGVATNTPVVDTSGTPTTWRAQVASALAEGTYQVIATVADSGGSTLQDTTTNELTVDTTRPSLSSQVPNGGEDFSANSNVILVFDEPVRTGAGNITITGAGSSIRISANDTSQVTGSGTADIVINPSNDLDLGQGYELSISTTAFTDLAGNAYGGGSVNFTVVAATSPPDPGAPVSNTAINEDIASLIETQADMVVQWAYTSMSPMTDRMSWLRRNRCSKDISQKDIKYRCRKELSHQGIRLNFANPALDALFNAQLKENSRFTQKRFADMAKTLSHHHGNSTINELKKELGRHAINEFAKLKRDTLNKYLGKHIALTPAIDISDTWAIWTAGNVTFGDFDKTGTTSKQKIRSNSISFGVDRYLGNDHLLGLAASLGTIDTDANAASTAEIKSDAYSLSVYSAFQQDNNVAIESIVGMARIDANTQRRDSNNVLLTGSRDIKQLFASLTFRGSFQQQAMNLSPYGRISASYTRLDGYAESGSDAALVYAHQSINDVALYTGLDIDYLIAMHKSTLRPYALIEYGANLNLGSDANLYYLSVPGETPRTIATDDDTTHNLKFGVGLEYQAQNGAYGSVTYKRTEIIDSGHTDSFDLELGFEF